MEAGGFRGPRGVRGPKARRLSSQGFCSTGGGTVDSIEAGPGIAVDNTDPINPKVSNTGVTSLAPADGSVTVANTGTVYTIKANPSAPTGVQTLSPSDSTITVNNVGTAYTIKANPTGVQSLTPGDSSMTVSNVGTAFTVKSNGVQSVGAFDGSITIGGTAAAPTIKANCVQSLAPADGTITISGTAAIPTIKANPTGVQTLTPADSTITVNNSGTAYTIKANPTGVQTLTPADGTITVNNTGTAYTIKANPTGVQSISAGNSSISITGTSSAPIITAAPSGIQTIAGIGSGISVSTVSSNTQIQNTGVTAINAAGSMASVNQNVGVVTVSVNPPPVKFASNPPSGTIWYNGLSLNAIPSMGGTAPVSYMYNSRVGYYGYPSYNTNGWTDVQFFNTNMPGTTSKPPTGVYQIVLWANSSQAKSVSCQMLWVNAQAANSVKSQLMFAGNAVCDGNNTQQVQAILGNGSAVSSIRIINNDSNNPATVFSWIMTNSPSSQTVNLFIYCLHQLDLWPTNTPP